MDSLQEALLRASAPEREGYAPMFFRLARPEDHGRLAALLADKPWTIVHDDILPQLAELLKVIHPSRRFDKKDLDEAILSHLNGQDLHAYGVWVYYPWAGKVVHLLDEAEFVRVRTDRNRNKITTEEQRILSSKRVGVIGLSVGQSVCLTMAMERSFGELRIADLDALDLSNLNRIRSSSYSLRHQKTVNVAREIAEMDPFLKVEVYSEGATKENLDDFLTKDGKLDLLIEECDSVDIKLLARVHARKHGIPVVMDTSDRGMIDIERFDLEPNRPLLHGLLDGLDLTVLENAVSTQEKLPIMAKLVGLETISERMKASLPELGKSILTWPQLASAVVLGGALVADITRRIMLGEPIHSQRTWVDLDQIFPAPDQRTPNSSNR